ncbi:MAG TPA: cupin domain-containing protein [Polyangia bacterium]|nr:cupin domain-containing protein [Polyangia bacterium]
MSNPVNVSRFEVKAHDQADEVRTPSKTRVEVLRMEGYTLAYMGLQPGWRWSECIKPVVHTHDCRNSHVGYAVSGRLTVEAGGTRKSIGAGDVYTIPPGHDAWVDGNEPFVCIEVLSAEEYAKAP